MVAAVTVVPTPGARALAGCVELDLSGFSSTPLRFELVGQGSMCFTVDGHGHFMPSVGSADASWSPQVQVSYDVTDNNHAARGGSVATSYDFTDTAPVKITVSGTPPAGISSRGWSVPIRLCPKPCAGVSPTSCRSRVFTICAP